MKCLMSGTPCESLVLLYSTLVSLQARLSAGRRPIRVFAEMVV